MEGLVRAGPLGRQVDRVGVRLGIRRGPIELEIAIADIADEIGGAIR